MFMIILYRAIVIFFLWCLLYPKERRNYKPTQITKVHLLPSLETSRIMALCIYGTNQRFVVVFGVHKHNERDNFIHP